MPRIIVTLCLMAWITGYVEAPMSGIVVHNGGNCYVLDEKGTPVISNAVILTEKDGKALLHIKVPKGRIEAVMKHKGWLAWSKEKLLELKPELGLVETIKAEDGTVVEIKALPKHNF